jgi:hypothetical protein
MTDTNPEPQDLTPDVPVSEGGEEGQEAGTVTPPAETPAGPSEVPDTPAHDKTDQPAETVSEIHGRATDDRAETDE